MPLTLSLGDEDSSGQQQQWQEEAQSHGGCCGCCGSCGC